jgi:hypothetical protein
MSAAPQEDKTMMQPSNGQGHEDKSGVLARRQITGRPPELGEVVRDAMDHAHLIARDTVSLGRLEVEGVIAKAKGEALTVVDRVKLEGRTIAAKARDEAGEVVTRVAFVAIAATVGAVGTIFLVIAAFLGLGYLIPSLAARFAIFAVVFLLTSGIAAAMAGKKRGVPRNRRPPDERLRHIAPVHPVGGEQV